MKNRMIKVVPSGNNENGRNYHFKGKIDDFKVKNMFEMTCKLFVLSSGWLGKKER